MRQLINITEAATRPTHDVVRLQEPGSSVVIDRREIRAANKQDLHQQVRAWMDQLGLDPDDEDDQAVIRVTARV
jgi:hypothetical protein